MPTFGIEAKASTPEQLKARLSDDIAKWRRSSSGPAFPSSDRHARRVPMAPIHRAKLLRAPFQRRRHSLLAPDRVELRCLRRADGIHQRADFGAVRDRLAQPMVSKLLLSAFLFICRHSSETRDHPLCDLGHPPPAGRTWETSCRPGRGGTPPRRWIVSPL